MPRASATIALITSPCRQPDRVVAVLGPSLAFHSRTRRPPAWLSRHGLAGPGKAAADGVRLHGLPQRFLGQGQRAAGPVAVVALAEAVVERAAAVPAGPPAAGPAVCRQRSSGLVTTAASGTPASRAPRRSACAGPARRGRLPGSGRRGSRRRSRSSGHGESAGRWSSSPAYDPARSGPPPQPHLRPRLSQAGLLAPRSRCAGRRPAPPGSAGRGEGQGGDPALGVACMRSAMRSCGADQAVRSMNSSGTAAAAPA